ncbi:hypothetical protein GGR57DRAFT_486444 [Xylariaceae sp. FL1272]|nr:hypothetical protein GGR57DRAFT_486444 [Xylariaceae sp. FL1272]
MSESFDVIIVGGGTAGLALSSRLSEASGLQVLVLEAGREHHRPAYRGSACYGTNAPWY